MKNPEQDETWSYSTSNFRAGNSLLNAIDEAIYHHAEYGTPTVTVYRWDTVGLNVEQVEYKVVEAVLVTLDWSSVDPEDGWPSMWPDVIVHRENVSRECADVGRT